MSKRYVPPPLMSPAQRRELIEAPISVLVHGGRRWAGTGREKDRSKPGVYRQADPLIDTNGFYFQE